MNCNVWLCINSILSNIDGDILHINTLMIILKWAIPHNDHYLCSFRIFLILYWKLLLPLIIMTHCNVGNAHWLLDWQVLGYMSFYSETIAADSQWVILFYGQFPLWGNNTMGETELLQNYYYNVLNAEVSRKLILSQTRILLRTTRIDLK